MRHYLKCKQKKRNNTNSQKGEGTEIEESLIDMSENTSSIDSFSSEVSTHSSSEESESTDERNSEGERDGNGVEFDVQNITPEG